MTLKERNGRGKTGEAIIAWADLALLESRRRTRHESEAQPAEEAENLPDLLFVKWRPSGMRN